MAEKKVVLELEHVSKSFAKVESDDVTNALHDITVTMESGEFISLVGPSGCGKSTILRLVAGLIHPTLGKVTVNGREIDGPSPERGMVFQKPTLFPWLTVEKNIAFSLEMQGTLRGNEEKVRRMLHVIGLENFKDDYPAQLSGGMAQRVALVRSLINQPEILLLDEPLGALDAFTRMNMQDEILNIWSHRRQLALMVTHDVDEAIYFSDRVVVMSRDYGRIMADVRIDLPRPRDRASVRYHEYMDQLTEVLKQALNGEVFNEEDKDLMKFIENVETGAGLHEGRTILGPEKPTSAPKKERKNILPRHRR